MDYLQLMHADEKTNNMAVTEISRLISDKEYYQSCVDKIRDFATKNTIFSVWKQLIK